MVGLVTLALGAIGIINIMLVSVTERTREIGLRKALGATNRSILIQFFIEGAFLTAFSGGIGWPLPPRFMTVLAHAAARPRDSTRPHCPHVGRAAIVSLADCRDQSPDFIPRAKPRCCQPVEALRQE